MRTLHVTRCVAGALEKDCFACCSTQASHRWRAISKQFDHFQSTESDEKCTEAHFRKSSVPKRPNLAGEFTEKNLTLESSRDFSWRRYIARLSCYLYDQDSIPDNTIRVLGVPARNPPANVTYHTTCRSSGWDCTKGRFPHKSPIPQIT